MSHVFESFLLPELSETRRIGLEKDTKAGVTQLVKALEQWYAEASHGQLEIDLRLARRSSVWPILEWMQKHPHGQNRFVKVVTVIVAEPTMRTVSGQEDAYRTWRAQTTESPLHCRDTELVYAYWLGQDNQRSWQEAKGMEHPYRECVQEALAITSPPLLSLADRTPSTSLRTIGLDVLYQSYANPLKSYRTLGTEHQLYFPLFAPPCYSDDEKRNVLQRIFSGKDIPHFVENQTMSPSILDAGGREKILLAGHVVMEALTDFFANRLTISLRGIDVSYAEARVFFNATFARYYIVVYQTSHATLQDLEQEWNERNTPTATRR